MKTHKEKVLEAACDRLNLAVHKAYIELANSERIRAKNNGISYNRLLKIRELESGPSELIMEVLELKQSISKQNTAIVRHLAEKTELKEQLKKRRFDWMSFAYGSIVTSIIVWGVLEYIL